MQRRFAQRQMPLEYALRMFDQAMLNIQRGANDAGGLVV